MTAHVVACLWIIASKMADEEESWHNTYGDKYGVAATPSDLYLTSFYFTITTITTVGYGDFKATTFSEKIICIMIMIVGVMGFSYASGMFTTQIQIKAKSSAVLD